MPVSRAQCVKRSMKKGRQRESLGQGFDASELKKKAKTKTMKDPLVVDTEGKGAFARAGGALGG